MHPYNAHIWIKLHCTGTFIPCVPSWVASNGSSSQRRVKEMVRKRRENASKKREWFD